jgi:hypothetical protein
MSNNYIIPIGIISKSNRSTTDVTSKIGYAEFVQTSIGTNASISSTLAIQYTADSAFLVDTIGITTTVANNTNNIPQGTAFILPIGTYIVDHENSNITSGCSIAIYQGPNNMLFTMNPNTIVVTNVPGWVHGRSIVKSTKDKQYLMVGPITGDLYIGKTGDFTARITFLKIE